MTDIFISYASEDRTRAEPLARAFEARGWSVWWDRRILTGQTYDQVIERALGGAKCVVVLWSEHSVASEWVKNEATVALERGMLVPATTEPVTIPLEFRRRQTADLSDWDENPSHPGFQALCDGISAALGSGSTAPAITRANTPASVRSGSRSTRGWIPAAAIVAVLALVGLAYYAGARRAATGSTSGLEPSSAPLAQEQPSAAGPSRTTSAPASPAGPSASTAPPSPTSLDLLSAENGGQLLLAPNNEWAVVVDGKSDAHESVRVGESAVFAFKGERPATFDSFGMLIPRTGRNPKEFELFAGDESPTGAFRAIGTFHPQDARVFKTNGWQDFTFPPVTARYLKVRLRSNYEDTVWIELYEFRLTGRLADAR